MKASDFFTPEGRKLIEQAIAESELYTSAEIRVHVETFFEADVLDRASTVFARLKMHKTALRNAVLIFFVSRQTICHNRRFRNNKLVPENFWNDAKALMEDHFRNQNLQKVWLPE